MVILGARFSVVRKRATTAADPYSGRATALDWTSPDQRRIRDVSVLDDVATETTGRQDRVVRTMTVRAPGLPDVRARDRLRVGGVDWDVDGTPQRFADGIAHTVIKLKRVEG